MSAVNIAQSVRAHTIADMPASADALESILSIWTQAAGDSPSFEKDHLSHVLPLIAAELSLHCNERAHYGMEALFIKKQGSRDSPFVQMLKLPSGAHEVHFLYFWRAVSELIRPLYEEGKETDPLLDELDAFRDQLIRLHAPLLQTKSVSRDNLNLSRIENVTSVAGLDQIMNDMSLDQALKGIPRGEIIRQIHQARNMSLDMNLWSKLESALAKNLPPPPPPGEPPSVLPPPPSSSTRHANSSSIVASGANANVASSSNPSGSNEPGNGIGNNIAERERSNGSMSGTTGFGRKFFSFMPKPRKPFGSRRTVPPDSNSPSSRVNTGSGGGVSGILLGNVVAGEASLSSFAAPCQPIDDVPEVLPSYIGGGEVALELLTAAVILPWLAEFCDQAKMRKNALASFKEVTGAPTDHFGVRVLSQESWDVGRAVDRFYSEVEEEAQRRRDRAAADAEAEEEGEECPICFERYQRSRITRGLGLVFTGVGQVGHAVATGVGLEHRPSGFQINTTHSAPVLSQTGDDDRGQQGDSNLRRRRNTVPSNLPAQGGSPYGAPAFGQDFSPTPTFQQNPNDFSPSAYPYVEHVIDNEAPRRNDSCQDDDDAPIRRFKRRMRCCQQCICSSCLSSMDKCPFCRAPLPWFQLGNLVLPDDIGAVAGSTLRAAGAFLRGLGEAAVPVVRTVVEEGDRFLQNQMEAANRQAQRHAESRRRRREEQEREAAETARKEQEDRELDERENIEQSPGGTVTRETFESL